jgi:hypothetical protein
LSCGSSLRTLFGTGDERTILPVSLLMQRI